MTKADQSGGRLTASLEIDGLLNAYWGLAYDQGREDSGVDAYSALRAQIRTAIKSHVAETERLRDALRKIAEHIDTGIGAGTVDIGPDPNYTKSGHFNALVVSVRDTAHRALTQEAPND